MESGLPTIETAVMDHDDRLNYPESIFNSTAMPLTTTQDKHTSITHTTGEAELPNKPQSRIGVLNARAARSKGVVLKLNSNFRTGVYPVTYQHVIKPVARHDQLDDGLPNNRNSQNDDVSKSAQDLDIESNMGTPGIRIRRIAKQSTATPYRKGVLGLLDRATEANAKLNRNIPPCNYWVTIVTTVTLFIIYMLEGTFNYISWDGRCITGPIIPYPGEVGKPFVQTEGYGGCEHELGLKTKDRSFFGGGSDQMGYPEVYFAKMNQNWPTESGGISMRTLRVLGGLDPNYMRNYSEWFRIFSAMWMHASWSHIMMNLFVQFFFLWTMEPYWGALRMGMVFLIGGISGNLFTAVLDPCKITVGSSGAQYGTIGAMVPWSLENWKRIPMPLCMIFIIIIAIVSGVISDLSGITDNYAHMGGLLGGLLFGFATFKGFEMEFKDLKRNYWLQLILPPFGFCVTKKYKAKLTNKLGNDLIHRERGDDGSELIITDTVRRGAIMRYMLPGNRSSPKYQLRSWQPWILRTVAGVTLILLILLPALYLFVPNLYRSYDPPGRIKFSGYLFCNCCEINSKGQAKPGDLILPSGHVNRYYGNEGLWWCFSAPSDLEKYCNIN